MTKDPSRKPPKRKPIKPVVDEDLAELAAVIAEHKLETNSRGWFILPWQSGWNAAQLCLDIFNAHYEFSHDGIEQSAAVDLTRWLSDRAQSETQLVYWLADDLRGQLAVAQTETARALTVGLRCLMLHLAKSDGGGHIYNYLLENLYNGSDFFPSTVGLFVMQARCWDAIGVGLNLENDQHDRKRRAFKTAWERGLYHAAYAIGPVK